MSRRQTRRIVAAIALACIAGPVIAAGVFGGTLSAVIFTGVGVFGGMAASNLAEALRRGEF